MRKLIIILGLFALVGFAGCKSSREVAVAPAVISASVETIEDAFAEADLRGLVSAEKRARFWAARQKYHDAVGALRMAAQLGQPLEEYIRGVAQAAIGLKVEGAL